MQKMNIAIFIVFVALFTSHKAFSSQIPVCQEPHNIHDIYMNLTYQGPQEYFLLPHSNGGRKYISVPEEQQYIKGIKDCPNSQVNMRVTTITPLSERSTCPFYFGTTFDTLRYPNLITEARCSCTKCLDYHGLSPRNYCEPVYRDVKVLVKTNCHNNVWQYSVAAYKIQESCTCAVPRQIHQTENRVFQEVQPSAM